MFSATLVIANAVQFSVCSGVLRVLWDWLEPVPAALLSTAPSKGPNLRPRIVKFGYFPGVKAQAGCR